MEIEHETFPMRSSDRRLLPGHMPIGRGEFSVKTSWWLTGNLQFTERDSDRAQRSQKSAENAHDQGEQSIHEKKIKRDFESERQIRNVLSSAGASILGIGYLLPLIYFAWSIKYGAPAGDNPWNAAGLEWTTASPPPTHNFEKTPHVNHDPYNYEDLPKDIEIAREATVVGR